MLNKLQFRILISFYLIKRFFFFGTNEKKKPGCLRVSKFPFSGEEILSSAKEARDFYSQSYFGEYINGEIHYSPVEALYLGSNALNSASSLVSICELDRSR